MKLPEIRCDDVLQSKRFTSDQKHSLDQKTMFEWFLEADKVFAQYNYPMILAILEEGIDHEPEWVEYIKKNQHRYIIELHGREHIHYGELGYQDLLDNLFFAKRRIESEFGVKINNWYVPFGRKGRNQYAEDVCKLLGMKLWIPNGKVDSRLWFGNKTMPHVNFHFWKQDQIDYTNKIIRTLCQEESINI